MPLNQANLPLHPTKPLLSLAVTAIAISVCFANGFESEATTPAEPWNLIWSEEFDVDGPVNPKVWNHEQGFLRNGELQWYQPDNAFCEEGHLVIEGRREVKSLENVSLRKSFKHRKQIEYTSASITTHNKFSWQYGRLEVRAKIVAANGLWPAIWTLGNEGAWPSNGEVDLMEYYDDSILANVAWRRKNRSVAWDSSKTPYADLGPDWDNEFHIWLMEWDENSIKLSVDGRLLNETDLNAIDYDGKEAGVRNPFHQPHYVLLNLAIGGDKGGEPAKTDFPSRYLVDYVRVYQQEK